MFSFAFELRHFENRSGFQEGFQSFFKYCNLIPILKTFDKKMVEECNLNL